MINREGFWWSTDEPHLPKPIALDYKWKGRKEFLVALDYVEQVIASGVFSGRHSHQKGSSYCRICNNDNGSSEFRCTFMESTWIWPNGLRHYIKEHNVRPSLAFQEFILAVNAGRQVVTKRKK